MKLLDINSTRDLEDLCINTIYASLLTGKLSPQTQQFRIISCSARDPNPTTLDYSAMITTLNAWSQQCTLVLSEIAARIRDVKSESLARKIAEEEYEKAVEKERKAVASEAAAAAARKGSGGGRGKGRGGGQQLLQQIRLEDFDDDEFMHDIEEHPTASTSASASKARGRAGGRPGGGNEGDSPTRRKRKLVLNPSASPGL